MSPPSSRTSAAVRMSCQLIALCTGAPLSRSHTMVDSRWLAMPRATRSEGCSDALSSAPCTTSTTLRQISSGSCSTHPGRGKICSCSFWAIDTMRAERSKTMQREDAVPWSIAAT